MPIPRKTNPIKTDERAINKIRSESNNDNNVIPLTRHFNA